MGASQDLFGGTRARAVLGEPLEVEPRELGRRRLHGTLVESALADGAQERRRARALQRVQDPLVGVGREPVDRELSRAECVLDKALVHRRRRTHGMLPIDVAVHLVLGEEQRLECREPFLAQADRRASGDRIGDDGERVPEAVDVDLAVGHAAHHRVALEVVGLVEIDRPGDQPLQRRVAAPAHEREDALRRVDRELLAEYLAQGAIRDQRLGDGLVMRDTDLLERMRERIVPDVVQQRRGHDQPAVDLGDAAEFTGVVEHADGEAREMVRTEGVLEPRVRRAWVDEVREAELAHVAQPLERR